MQPVIGVAMGDPAGVGPEVTVRAAEILAETQTNTPANAASSCRPVIVGDLGVIGETVRRLSLRLRPYAWQMNDIYPADPRRLPVLAVTDLTPAARVPGQPTPDGGDAAYRYVEVGTRLSLDNILDGLVTAPICKAMWHAAGHHYPGHTELLAKLTRTPEVRMMLVGGGLRVILVTTHMRLAAVPDALSTQRIKTTIELAAEHLRRFHGLVSPRLAVAGLNPHAGEGGVFGDEEQRLIEPAVGGARAAGFDVVGPLPADTVFVRAAHGEFDGVVCQYHDQALIPLKLLAWKDGVNVSLGLPIVRTAPDHGTAFDIAGQNKASPCSMRAAISLAVDMARTTAPGRAHEIASGVGG